MAIPSSGNPAALRTVAMVIRAEPGTPGVLKETRKLLSPIVNNREGLRPEIASFALPLGTALKRDGATILQGFNAIFIAQIYHIPLTPSLLFTIGLSSFLVSFSTPGVPGSALITMATVLSAAGLPLEGIAIVAGIDRLTDGFKTVLNVIGNSSNAILLSRWEAPTPESAIELAPSPVPVIK